jgi:hypothetical protein
VPLLHPVRGCEGCASPEGAFGCAVHSIAYDGVAFPQKHLMALQAVIAEQAEEIRQLQMLLWLLVLAQSGHSPSGD